MATWSKTRAKLENEYLAESLRGRIQYFAVSYSRSPDHWGRAAIRLDGIEVLKSSMHEFFLAQYKLEKEIEQEFDCDMSYEMFFQELLDRGFFGQMDFYIAFKEFDNQSIEKSLHSQNPIVRIFALLDRRVGKRRLISLKEEMKNELDWVYYFYQVRLEAEGLI